MKKLFALLLAFVMLLSAMTLAGCEKDDTDPSSPTSGNNENNGDNGNNGNNGNNENEPVDLHALVSAAMKKTNEATSMSAVMTMDMAMDVMGTKTETNMTFNIQASMADPEKPVISMAGTMNIMEQEMPYSYYYDGEWMYVLVYGEGYKMRASLEEFQQEAGGTGELMVDLPKELFEGVTATTEDGVTKVELTANSDAFKNLYNEMLKELFADVLGENTDPVVVDEVKIVVSVADGYVKGFDMSFKASYTIGEDYIIYDVTESVVYESINEEVTPTPPEGYENFGEMDWG